MDRFLDFKAHHKELRRIVPIGEKTIFQWVSAGIVVPFQDAPQGKRRIYNFKNLVEFACALYLMRFSIPLKEIKPILRDGQVQENLTRDEYDFFILVFREDIDAPPLWPRVLYRWDIVKHNGTAATEVLDAVRDFPVVLSLNVAKIKEYVTYALEQFYAPELMDDVDPQE